MSDHSQNEDNSPFPPPRFGPALSGGWFLFLGALMGPAIVFYGRDPQNRVMVGALLTVAMVGLLMHRLSLSYSFDGEKIKSQSWWGLGRPETLALVDLAHVDARSGFSSRLVGQAHLFLASSRPDEAGLLLLSQKRPEELAERLMALAEKARAAPRPAPPASPENQPLKEGP